MQLFPYLFAIFCLLAGSSQAVTPKDSSSPKPIKVVATLPVLKDFVEQVGKKRVEVKSLLTGLESEHTYTPRPTDIISIREASMLVKVGLGLEVWAEGLISNAQNPRLLILTTSRGVPLMNSRTAMKGTDNKKNRESPSHKNEDHLGNPHIWLDPENAKIMIRHITEGLIKLDPASKPFYLKNQAAYFRMLDELQNRLLKSVQAIKNRKMIAHHSAWPYFARRFGFSIRGNIISQVGSEPSAQQIANLIKLIKREKIRVIVSEPQLHPRLPEILAEETGATVVILTPLPGSMKGAESYLSMIEYNVKNLIKAFAES
jgi:ABC-type Zn uptake system ZnuABC Zn-binding protein ZnuA